MGETRRFLCSLHGISRVLLLLSIARFSFAAVFTLDYGSENLKVAVVNPKPGRSPIDIAINEYSKRKSPALVAISNGERLLSEEAAGIVARYPDRVYARVRDMVGRPAKDVVGMLKENYLPYEIGADEDRSTVTVKSHDGSTTYYAEELMALIIGYARDLADAHAKSAIKDAVISVPPYFSQSQRQAILDAAQIAGVNVMALIQEHAGVAIQYGIDKDFSNASKNVIIYDMGANSLYVALVHYSSYTTKDRGKNVTANQFQVKGLRWDAELGGQTMELRLVEYFADEFNVKSGLGQDVRSSAKAMAKLRKEVKRTKEILSANTEAPLNVESLFEDVDFRTSITREKFEELCAELWERALEPLRGVLADAGLTLADIDAVELVGGATRVPKLQSTLATFVGEPGLAKHLDADEALALGSSLLAANLSDGFKLNRKIGMLDGVPYGIQYRVHLDEAAVGGEEEAHEAQLLFPRLKKLPSKVIRSLKELKDDFTLELMYDVEDDLPPPLSSRQISMLEVTGVANASAKYGSYNLSAPIKTTLHFSLSRSGLVALDKAEAVVEFHEWVEVPVTPPPADPTSNGTSSNNSTEGAATAGEAGEEVSQGDSSGEGDGDAGKAEEVERPKGEDAGSGGADGAEGGGKAVEEAAVMTKKKLRKRTIRIPLKIKDVSEGTAKPLPAEAISEARERLEALAAKEKQKRDTAEAKNSLEAFIYATKDKLEYDDDLATVSTKKERDALGKQLSEVEDWLYMDGEEASASEFRKQLAALKKSGEKMFSRVEELSARPTAVEEARKFIRVARETLETWSSSKPWINETDKVEVLREVDALEKWLEEKVAQQKKQKLTEDPVFKAATVVGKAETIREKVARLNRIPKPKPKPPPKATTDNETTKDNATDTSTTADGEKSPEFLRTGADDEESNQTETGEGESHDEL